MVIINYQLFLYKESFVQKQEQNKKKVFLLIFRKEIKE